MFFEAFPDILPSPPSDIHLQPKDSRLLMANNQADQKRFAHRKKQRFPYDLRDLPFSL